MCCVSDLQKIMAKSRDYDELLFAWKGWRDSAGKVLRQDYKRYVELANTAAKLNGTTSIKESFQIFFSVKTPPPGIFGDSQLYLVYLIIKTKL